MKRVSWSGRTGLLLMLVVLFAGLAGRRSHAGPQSKIEAGEETYRTYCLTCHGEELVNSGQTFDLRRLKPGERPRFERSVLNGKNQMPPWKGVLNEEQLDGLWSYIRAHAFEQ
jgi:mono/diheme cytochrome c family protein